MKKSIRLFITGSIQGVFFRKFILDNAEKNKVCGYVRNMDDGRVEVFLEGDQEKVNEMINICKKGSKYSQIRNVEEKKESFQGFKEFKILRI